MFIKKHLFFFVFLSVVTNSWLAPLFAPGGNEEAPAQGLPKPPQQPSLTHTSSSPSSAQDPVNATPLACSATHPQSFAPILLHTTPKGTSDLTPTEESFPLFCLPEELWQLILDCALKGAVKDCVVTQEWKNLRLTCRAINQYVTNEAFFKGANSYLQDIDDITRFITPDPLEAPVDFFLTHVILDVHIADILSNPDPRTLTKEGPPVPGVGWSPVPYTSQDIEAVATLKNAIHRRPEQFTLNVLDPTNTDILNLAGYACPVSVSFERLRPNFERLSTFQNLKELRLKQSALSLGDLSRITTLEVLKLIVPSPAFGLPPNVWGGAAPQDLGQANMMPALQTLEAMGIPPNLKTIMLQNCQGLTDIKHLLKLPKLRSCDIHNCPLVPQAQITTLGTHLDARCNGNRSKRA